MTMNMTMYTRWNSFLAGTVGLLIFVYELGDSETRRLGRGDSGNRDSEGAALGITNLVDICVIKTILVILSLAISGIHALFSFLNQAKPIQPSPILKPQRFHGQPGMHMQADPNPDMKSSKIN
jgi:hypothetical protein